MGNGNPSRSRHQLSADAPPDRAVSGDPPIRRNGGPTFDPTKPDAENARSIVEKIHFAFVATATAEGAPWNSPVFFAISPAGTWYWASARASVHSQNIERSSEAFLVVCDSTAPEGGGKAVYARANVRVVDARDELAAAIELLYRRAGRSMDEVERFWGTAPRRIYAASPLELWISDVETRDGVRIDVRRELPVCCLSADDRPNTRR